MAINTTVLVLTTTPAALISAATTWASIQNASLTDKVPFSVQNAGAIPVRLGGAGLSTVAGAGFPLLSSAVFTADLGPGDAVFAVCSATTAAVNLMAGRQ